MNAMKLHVLAIVVSVLTAGAMTAAPASAASPAAAAHDHAAATPSKLSLDQGRRWGTDQPLRDGMSRIRSLVEPELDKAHRGKLTPAQYAALAQRIDTEVGGIVVNCKLEPQADAMLHLILGDMATGTQAMAGKTAQRKPQQGLAQVAAAVNDYGRYFDDPGFKPIHLGH